MSISSQASLGSLRQQAMEVSDNEQNPAISIQAWNSFIDLSHKKLFDMLVGAYDNNYKFAQTYQFSLTNSQLYPLPDGTAAYQNTTGSTAAKFYKLLGVDLQYSASPSGWITLKRFNFIDRNRWSYPNTTVNTVGYTNLRYSLQGNNLMMSPSPSPGQQARIWYVPAPTNLQFRMNTNVVGSVSTLAFPDTTGLTIGMNVFGTGIVSGTTITAVGSTTITMSNAGNAAVTSSLISMWDDGTLVEGVSGWEEFIIIDAALKSQNKQENDVSVLGAQRADIIARIEAMAEARDAGMAFHTSDVLGTSTYSDTGWGSNGWGGGDMGGY